MAAGHRSPRERLKKLVRDPGESMLKLDVGHGIPRRALCRWSLLWLDDAELFGFHSQGPSEFRHLRRVGYDPTDLELSHRRRVNPRTGRELSPRPPTSLADPTYLVGHVSYPPSQRY